MDELFARLANRQPRTKTTTPEPPEKKDGSAAKLVSTMRLTEKRGTIEAAEENEDAAAALLPTTKPAAKNAEHGTTEPPELGNDIFTALLVALQKGPENKKYATTDLLSIKR